MELTIYYEDPKRSKDSQIMLRELRSDLEIRALKDSGRVAINWIQVDEKDYEQINAPYYPVFDFKSEKYNSRFIGYSQKSVFLGWVSRCLVNATKK